MLGCGLFVKIAAAVNSEKITLDQVDKAIGQIAAENPKSPIRKKDKQTRLQVLNTLIENVLYREEAKRLGIEVTDNEVEEIISQARKRFETEAHFTKALEDIGLTVEDFRDNVRIRLIKTAVNEKVVKDTKVTEKEMRDYYEKNRDMFNLPEQVKIGFIQLKTQEGARDVLAKIRGGMDFDEAMLRFSTDLTVKIKGVRSAFVQRGQFNRLSPRVDEFAFSLPAGEVTEPFQTPAGWVLMKVYEKKAATKGTYEEVKGDIERMLKINKWLDEARKKAKVKIYL